MPLIHRTHDDTTLNVPNQRQTSNSQNSSYFV